MKLVSSFEVIHHGVENSSYFQGAGISHTKFKDIATGCGSTEKEALEEALEMLASNEWDVESLEKRSDFLKSIDNISDENPVSSDDTFYYLSILVA